MYSLKLKQKTHHFTLHCCILLVFAILLIPAHQVVAKPITIKVGHVGAPVSPQQAACDIFEKLVEEKTGGTVKIKQYGAATLGDERELVEGLTLGSIQGAVVSSGLYGGYYPMMSAFEIPFLFRDRAHCNAVNNGPVGKEILGKLNQKANINAIAIWEHGFRQMTNNARPIKVPKDLEGLKIRSPEVPVYSVALNALKAVPIPLAFSELYVALDRSVVDGQHNPLLHVMGQRFYEVQKYLSMLDFAYTPNVLAFSNATWGKLSAEQQNQVLAAALEAGIKWSEEAAEEEDRLLKELKDKMQVADRNDIDKTLFQTIVVEKAFPKYRETYGDILDRIVAEGK
jgi:C4-dicarboxylate-binding protein DctP